MNIFLDFDNTLVHTRKFFREIYTPLLLQSEKTSEEIEEAYKKFSTGPERGLETFTPARHMELLSLTEEARDVILQEIEAALEQNKSFLFQDTLQLLQMLKEHCLYLLTYGHTEFQGLKIRKSGLTEHFQEIFITDGSKIEVMRRVTGNEPFVFVDDKEKFFSELKEEFGDQGYGVHFLHSDIGEKCHLCDADTHAKNAKELINYIQSVCAE